MHLQGELISEGGDETLVGHHFATAQRPHRDGRS